MNTHNKVMDKPKRGRPPGIHIYKNKVFTKHITSEPKTPDQVRKEIHRKTGKWISWNTIHKRLDGLVTDGIIFKRRMGRYHLYQSVPF